MSFYKHLKLVERIVLETESSSWITLSNGGSGILAQAIAGKHDEDLMETRRTALGFVHRVIDVVGMSPAQERIPTPQILIDAADKVIEDPNHVYIICTVWRVLPEGIEICSVGTNTVFVFEGNTLRKAIAPQNINELLRNQGKVEYEAVRGGLVTHALTSQRNRKSCSIDDVRVAFVPLLPTTTIAVIANWRLAEAIMQQAMPREDLPSFIERWVSPGKRDRTSVLLSL